MAKGKGSTGNKGRGKGSRPAYPNNKPSKTGGKSGGGRSNNAPSKGGGKGKKNRGAPMVATGDGKIPYTYPTGNSDDY